MTKRRKLKRANKPVPEERSRYATRQRLPWKESHKNHTVPVHACPYCMPGAQPVPDPSPPPRFGPTGVEE